MSVPGNNPTNPFGQPQPPKLNLSDDFRVVDEKREFRFIAKCYDNCVTSFAEKHLNPFERECFSTCLQNLTASHIEMANGLNLMNPK